MVSLSRADKKSVRDNTNENKNVSNAAHPGKVYVWETLLYMYTNIQK